MRNRMIFVAVSLIIGCTPINARIAKSNRMESDCQISCEYMKHLSGRDGQKGCEETKELTLRTGEIVSCIQQCKDKQIDNTSFDPKCFLKAKVCDQIEKVCQ